MTKITIPERIWATQDIENGGEDAFHSVRPFKGGVEYTTVASIEAATQAAVVRALEAAAGECDEAKDKRNHQRRNTNHSPEQSNRWMAGALQASSLAESIRAIASDPARVARMARTTS